MRDKLLRYGREGNSFQIDSAIGLGCCLSKFGIHSQNDIPVYRDESRGVVLVGDALIYNWSELAEQCCLGGRDIISTQALLLEAYFKWGEESPKHINGDFAFAVWERRKKSLFVARDHLGVRPLYYAYDGSVFAFATDYRALLALPSVDRAIDEQTLYASLANVCAFNSEATYFKGIKALPQAHTLYIDEKGIRKTKYWRPGKNGRIRYETEAEYAEALRAIVEDAVKIRVLSGNGKMGAELSGGLDSSVITIIANRALARAGKTLELFSWSPSFKYMGRLPNDERTFVERVCRQEGLECAFFEPSIPSRDPDEVVPPYAGDAAVIRQERDVMAQKGVTFVLSGWGGDQGISRRPKLLELLLTGCWAHFIGEIRHLAKGSPWRFCGLLISNSLFELFRPYGYFGKPDPEILTFMSRTLTKKEKRHSGRDVLYFSLSPVRHLESGYIQNRTESAAWMDAETSIQHVYPFLDYRVVDFSMAIPRHLYYKNGVSRYVFREAFSSILPKEICRYMPKNDFAKSAYFSKTLMDTSAKTKLIVEELDRGLFSGIIDFAALTNQARNPAVNDKKNVILRKRRVLTCHSIQKILAETRTSSQTRDED
ncbi:MAG TPA: asparagine synthase-related protein [Rectinemataceae bacterium]|nr:asparagine synthase-related protein [Rectinemataceae bacterium]